MPKFKVKGIGEVEIPEGASQEEAYAILQRAVGGGQKQKPDIGITGQLGGILTGIIPGAIKGVSAIPEGIGGILDSDTLKQFGRDIRENPVSKFFIDVPEGFDGYGRQVGEIGGQLLTMLAPGSIARGPAMLGRGLSAATGMSQAAAEQVQRAAENRMQGMEVTPEQETSAARVGSLTGLLDLLPYERFLRGANAAKGLNLAKEAAEMGVMKQAGRAAGTGVIEGGTEAAQQYLQNAIEGRYNAAQSATEGIGDNAAAGFGAGALLEALTGVRARGIGRDVMARRDAVESMPVAPLAGVDSVSVRRGEGGDPLVDYLARIAPEQTRPMPDMPRESYRVPKTPLTEEVKKAAALNKLQQQLQQTMPEVAPQQLDLPRESYRAPEEAPVPLTRDEIIQQRMQQLIPDMQAQPMDMPMESYRTPEVPPTPLTRDEIIQQRMQSMVPDVSTQQMDLPRESYRAPEEPATFEDRMRQMVQPRQPTQIDMPRESYRSPVVEPTPIPLTPKQRKELEIQQVQQQIQNAAPRGGSAIDPMTLPKESYGKKKTEAAPAEVPPTISITPLKNGKFKVGLVGADGKPVGTSWSMATREAAEAKGAAMLAEKTSTAKLSLDEPTATPTTYTVDSLRQEIQAGTKPQIALDVFAEMKALGVDDLLSTRLIDSIPNAQGSYSNRVVQLALSGKSKADLLRTLNHESVHGMKEMGLFNDAEWAILNKSFNPNTSLTPQEKEQYAKLYGGNAEMVNEEAVARGIEKYAAGQINADPQAVSIVGKVLRTVDRLGNVLRGKGFQNTNDVLQSFRTGDIGSRPANLPPAPPAPRTLKEYEKTAYGNTKIPNGTANQPVVQPKENLGSGTVNGRSTELEDFLTEDQAPQAAGEVERKSIVPQLPVAGTTPFAKPDERTQLQKARDTFIREEGLGGIGLKLRQNILDMWAGVAELGYKAGDTTARSGSEAAVRNADASIDMAAANLKHGALELIGTPGNGYFRAGKDPANAPAVVFKEAYQAGKLDRLFHYLAAERADVLRSEGREKKITPQQVADWRAYGRDPEIAGYAKRWKAFNDQMIDTLQKSGRIDAETAVKFKKNAYLPFYRVVENADGAVNFQSSGSTMASAPRLQKLKGSELDIGDPTDNIVRNVNTLTSMAMKNVAMQRVVRDGLKTGYIKQVPKPVANKANMKVWVNGKEKHFEVLDPILYDSIMSSRIPSSTALKVAGMPSNFLRFMVTHDPVFMVNNPVRDSFMAWLQGYTDFPMQQIFKSAAAAIKNKPSFQALEKAGVVGSGIRGEGGATGTGANLRELYTGSESLKNKLDSFSNKSEGLTRDTVYRAVMERTGGDEAQAQYEARELLNFGRRGSHHVTQLINALIPFQNAAWQGADVLYRSAVKGRGANPQMQKQLGTRLATMASLSALYAVAASQMPAWQNATDEERDANWFIPVGDGEAVKVKIPFEAGYFAKVVPERVVAMYMGHDTGREFLSAFDRFLKSTIKLDVVPQGMKPASEVSNNFSTFRGKSIEPEYMRDREKSQRFDENTSELAKEIGKHTDQLSPLQIDHLLRGYGGALGIYATQLGSLLANPDKAAAALSVDEKMPHDIPVLGRFFQRGDSGKELATYYETTDKGVQAKNALKAGLEPTDERVGLAQYEKAQSPIYKRIQAINKREKAVREAMNTGAMDPGDARAMLRDYREAKLELARQANEMSKPLR